MTTDDRRMDKPGLTPKKVMDDIAQVLTSPDFQGALELKYDKLTEELRKDHHRSTWECLVFFLMGELILKAQVEKELSPRAGTPSLIGTEGFERLMLRMSLFNQYRLRAMEAISDYLVYLYERINVLMSHKPTKAQQFLKQVKSVSNFYQKQIQQLPSMHKTFQSEVYEQTAKAILSSLQIGEVLLEKTEKGNKFAKFEFT